MKRRSFFQLSTTAALGAALSGCLSPDRPPLKIGTEIWIGHEFLYAAELQGYWDAKTIQRLDYPSLSETVRAYRNQRIGVAAVTLLEAIELMDTHPETRVFLVIDFSHGSDVILSRPEIQHLKGLKGRRIGLESAPLGYYMLTRGLQQAGLMPSEVELVRLGLEEQEAALNQGLIDGLVTCDPVRTSLMQSGAQVLFDSSQIPGEIVDVLVTNTATLHQFEAAHQILVEAWFKSLSHFQQNPIEAANPMAERENMMPAEFLNALKLIRIPDRAENQRLLSRADPMLYGSAVKLQDFMLDQKILKRPVNLQHLLTAQFVH